LLKLFIIGLKDLRITFRDRAALILMLGAPFVLTLGLGLVTGRFSGDAGSGLSDIPVVIVNQDNGQLGVALVDVFHSLELADLMEPSLSSDPEAARRLIDEDEATAAIIIPADFTRSVFDSQTTEPVRIEVYTNPSRPTSAGIVRAILEEFLSRVEENRLAGLTAIQQFVRSERLPPEQIEAVGRAITERLQGASPNDALAITINASTAEGETVEFDLLAYIAPGMALLFLMYTVTYGGRSILAERAEGTLPRLLISPTQPAQILGGKVFGIFLTGAAQMLILIGASYVFFGLKWGDPVGVFVLVLAAVFGATGWGMLITSLARSPAQVATIGSAVMLIFGILGGSFIDVDEMPTYVQTMSKITPNAWSLDGFTTLGLGGRLADLNTPIAALLIMGAALFTVSAILFGRRNLMQK
jgi:ABC-2 type transport system permease protein